MLKDQKSQESIRKIAVIGAGVSGLCVAIFAAKSGAHVTVFEKEDFPPRESASAMAGGMLAPLAELETLPLSFVKAGLSGIEIWKNLLKDNSCFQQTGSLIVAHKSDEAMLDRFKSHLRNAPKNSWAEVNGAEIESLEPHLAGRFERGLYLKDDAHLDPSRVMLALLAALKGAGAELIKREVNPAEINGDFDDVIDCRGYVASEDDGELRGVKGEIVVIKNDELRLSRPVRLAHPRYPLYIVPHANGHFAVGATVIEDSSDDDGRVFVRSALELLGAAYALHPCLGEAKIVSLGAGIRPAYPDNLPRITNDARVNGMFRHGFLLAPVVGRAIVHKLNTGQNDDFMHLFSGRMNI